MKVHSKYILAALEYCGVSKHTVTYESALTLGNKEVEIVPRDYHDSWPWQVRVGSNYLILSQQEVDHIEKNARFTDQLDILLKD